MSWLFLWFSPFMFNGERAQLRWWGLSLDAAPSLLYTIFKVRSGSHQSYHFDMTHSYWLTRLVYLHKNKVERTLKKPPQSFFASNEFWMQWVTVRQYRKGLQFSSDGIIFSDLGAGTIFSLMEKLENDSLLVYTIPDCNSSWCLS